MDALLASTVFGLGLLFVFDALVRPERRSSPTALLKKAGPRTLAGGIGAAAGYVGTGWPIAALACGAVAAAVPGMLRRTRDERARLERREAIAEVSSRLRDAIRSGIGIADALANAAESAPARIRGDLRRLVAEARVSGLQDAARAFAERVAIPPRICSPPRSGRPNASARGTCPRCSTLWPRRRRRTRPRSGRLGPGRPRTGSPRGSWRPCQS